MIKFEVEEVPGENINVIRFKGNDLRYIVLNGVISVYLDDETCDSIAFQIQSLLQDKDLRKKT